MLINKEILINLLDNTSSTYDEDILLINLLPKDAIFEITIEEVVMAEYYNECDGNWYRFKLDHDYLSNVSSSLNYDYTMSIDDGYDEDIKMESEYNKLNSELNSLIISKTLLVIFTTCLCIWVKYKFFR